MLSLQYMVNYSMENPPDFPVETPPLANMKVPG